ncbi:MmcQ/YjbR family DNA-binding protein [Vagococcus fluvialis]|uniref:MmcQ/YjbR family DNA-binding protein n=1 Tax=Vagococcus fluvialis TaxID=2738 RepID=UPI003B5C7726
MIKERMKSLQEFGKTLPHAKVYYREDWDCIYFDLLGKQFGLMSKEATDKSFITLKGNPETNEILRETYDDIIPGYYANKKHWNSIYLKTSEITNKEMYQMIQTSYDLVWKNLPAKIRKEHQEKS